MPHKFFPANTLFFCLVLVVLALHGHQTAFAAEPNSKGIVSLADFGDLSTPNSARQAYDKALSELSRTGGLLVIPSNVAKHLQIENSRQTAPRSPSPPAETKSWSKAGPGITIVEVNETGTIIRVPPIEGLRIQRTLRMDSKESLPHWSTDFAVNIHNKLIHGSNSYLDWIVEPVRASPDARFYVRSNRGVRPGQFLTIHAGPGYSGAVTRAVVKSIGFDPVKNLDFFTADTSIDHVAGAIAHNKNNAGLLYMEQNANADEQTYDVMLRRRQYANGDTYMFFGWYEYMSNIHSATGDENGNIFAGYSESHDNAFSGAAESVDWDSRFLRFAPSAKNIETLGQSRPLINMNPKKWITEGSVVIVPAESYWDPARDTGKYPFQGKTYPSRLEKGPSGNQELRMGGLIRGDKNTPWDRKIIGRWFGITEENEKTPTNKKIRWYRIVDLTVNSDGTKDLVIQRYWWGAKPAHSPTLYRLENNTWDGHIRPLRYAIAPGSYVTDVSKAIPGDGYAGERLLGLTPYVDAKGAFDFQSGDLIEQAIGSDPFKPNPFRMWTWDHVPGVFPSPVLDLANFGADPRFAALAVRGNQSTLDEVKQTQRQLPPWENAIVIEAAAGVGINMSADFSEAAILFQQKHAEQPIKWFYGKREAGKPISEATLTVSKETGTLNFSGNASLSGSLTTQGLSAESKPAHNLRGKNVSIPAGQTSFEVTFQRAELDGNYAVFVEQSWIATRAVINKSPKGFTVQFERAAPKGATLDWMIVR